MNDLVSRQAVYIAMVEKGQASKRYKLGEEWELNGAEIREALETVPFADRPTGEWVAYRSMQPPELHGKFYCSNCYHAIHLASNGNVYNYCPNCGARMKDGNE